MRTISARKLSLDKARSLGVYEEPVTIDDCELVLRNLRPDEYEQVIAECAGLEDVEYIFCLQKAHVARAICAVNGVDLRDVAYIEEEEEDKSGKPRTVKVERHSYLRKNIVDTWSKEALFVAYRKFGEVVGEAEKKARDGITFRTSDETPEEKFRRLLGEAKEAQVDIEPEIAERVLAEYGYLVKRDIDLTSLEMASTRSQPDPVVQAPVEAQPEAAPSPKQQIDPATLMRQRVPLNQAPTFTPSSDPKGPSQVTVPETVAPPPEQGVRRAQPTGSVPQVASVAVPAGPQVGRAAEIAAQMAEEERLLSPQVSSLLSGSSQGAPEVAVLSGTTKAADPNAVKSMIDIPPTGGINPRYRPSRQ